VETLKYLESKILTNGSVKEEIIERIKCRTIFAIREGHFLEIGKSLKRGQYTYLNVTTCPYHRME
jgi:hypothetical protein